MAPNVTSTTQGRGSASSQNEPAPQVGADRTYITLSGATQTGAAEGGMLKARHISAEHLLLALVAMKARPGTRWAALSNGAITPSCAARRRGDTFAMATPPMLTPLSRGRMHHLLERVRNNYGRQEVMRTWGAGMRALKAEFSSFIIRSAA